jgi:dTDP-4-amino-4,6-dideoxygalactose transaminase
MIYHEGLADLSGIVLTPMRNDSSHVYLYFPIQVDDRDKLQRYMIRHGRDVAIQHIGNAADYDCFKKYRLDCPNARRTASSVLLLPTYPGYRPTEARKNVKIIRRFFSMKPILSGSRYLI